MMNEKDYRYERVLLIDDNELDNFINEKTIESARFAERIFKTTSGSSAKEFLDNLVTMGESGDELFPQVIFVDINMPVMDGMQFLTFYTKHSAFRNQASRLVVLTSSVFEEDRQRVAAIFPGVIYLNKPLSAEALKNI